MWQPVPKTDSFVFFCCGWAYKREILRNQFLQTDFTLLNGERNQFYSSTKGKLFRVVSWRKCMVGMFGGVKLGGGGKLVMGEVCRIRIRKSVAVSLNYSNLKTCPPRRPPKRPHCNLASLAYPSDPQYNSA